MDVNKKLSLVTLGLASMISGLAIADTSADALMTSASKPTLDKTKMDGETFLKVNKAKPGVVALASGLQYKILKAGTGPKPASTDTVVVDYAGTLLDGTEFDSSFKRGVPATFPVTGVIPGWVEALQLMPVGSSWELYIPSALAYGESGAGGAIGPNQTLIFKVNLIDIKK